MLGHERLWEQPWPVADESQLVRDTFELVVQVNGKVRDRFEVEASAVGGRARRARARVGARAGAPRRRDGAQDDRRPGQARQLRRRLTLVFTVDDRRRVQRPRPRARRVGSTRRRRRGRRIARTRSDGDRWSDLDLTFAVADGVPVDGRARGLDACAHRDELDAVAPVRPARAARASTACSSSRAASSSTSRSRRRPPSARRARSSSCSSAKRSSARSASRRLPRSCSATASTTRCAARVLDRARPRMARRVLDRARSATTRSTSRAASEVSRQLVRPRLRRASGADVLADASQGAIVRSLDRDELLRGIARARWSGLLREGGELAGAVEPNLATLRHPTRSSVRRSLQRMKCRVRASCRARA